FEADTPREARDRARGLIDELQLRLGLARLATPAFEPEAMERLWHAREAALPSLYALGDGQRPLAFVEDVGVPPEALAEFIPRAQDLLQGFETTASFLVHALTGQVHIRPFLDLDRPEDSAKLWPIAEALYGLVWEHGGTISAQHGTGLARTPWVGKQLGRLYPLLRELKAVFDPQGLFNPGKIVGPDPSLPAWPLRSAAAAQPPGNGRVALPAAGLVWAPGEAAGEVARCNGCGDCRAEAPPARMCPMFRVTHAEDATPRAKANLLRHLLNGGAATPPSADEVRAVADLCINCRMCPRECPARVNVPKLMIEARAANLAEHGLARADWVLARTEHFAALGSAFAPVTNLLLRSRAVRWAVEKLFGVSRRRRLPPFALRSFLRRAKHRGWTRKPKPAPGRERVAYFVDVFPNYNDPAVAEAAVAVLLHNGVQVYVPPEQTGCGMAPLAQGDVETAREVATRNVRAFAELAREGFRIVCSEPTAALMLSHDYLDLLDDPDARLVAGQTAELTAYLAELHRAGRLRTDFAPLELTLGHHVPCHLKALGGEPQGPGLLALIPNLRVRTIDKSCSGMAGTFGLKMENYAASLEAGRPMLDEMRRPGVLFGSTECSACRVQMEEGSGKTTLHPVQYLALAYGLMPELAGRLFPPRRKPVGP
ncbi:MAG TPA: anaerobic glycerol-3-phosphate dehydrogenase subunit C, partial [Gemmataceae bacterium]